MSSDEEDEDLGSMSREDLEDLYLETRGNLEQAASMGQALMVDLQQMELLKQEMARLEEQRDEWEQSREEHEYRVEELEEVNQRLENSVQEAEDSLREVETQLDEQQGIINEYEEEIQQLKEGQQTDDPSSTGGERKGSGGGATAARGAGGRRGSIQPMTMASSEASADQSLADAAFQLKQKEEEWKAQVARLEAKVEAMEAEEAELVAIKTQTEDARMATEREKKRISKLAESLQEQLSETQAELQQQVAAAEAAETKVEKQKDRANGLQLQLRMLEREFTFLRDALQQPGKEGAVASRLSQLDLVFRESESSSGGGVSMGDEAAEAEAARAAAEAAAKREEKEVTLMVMKNEIVSSSARLKLKVASLLELEATLQAKLKIEHPISLSVWDTAFADFVNVLSLDDLPGRCKVQVLKKDELPPEEPEEGVPPEGGAESGGGGGGDQTAEAVAEAAKLAETKAKQEAAAEAKSALARSNFQLEQLRVELAASRADASHCRALATKYQAELKKALGNTKYEEQQARMVERLQAQLAFRRKRRLVQSCFHDWRWGLVDAKADREASAGAESAASALAQAEVAAQEAREKSKEAERLAQQLEEQMEKNKLAEEAMREKMRASSAGHEQQSEAQAAAMQALRDEAAKAREEADAFAAKTGAAEASAAAAARTAAEAAQAVQEAAARAQAAEAAAREVETKTVIVTREVSVMSADELVVTECKCLGTLDVVGEHQDRPYTVYRLLLTAQDGGSWIVARRFSDFASLRQALRAVPKSAAIRISAPFPSKFDSKSAVRALNKRKAAADSGQKRDRCLLLEAWIKEVIKKCAGVGKTGRASVLQFCERDGSDVAVADISIVRRRLAGKEEGVATSGSSHSVQIKGCALEKLLGAEGKGRIGERTATEKSQYLLSTSREVEGMPTVVKKHFILSVLTPPHATATSTSKAHGVKHNGLVSHRWVEWVHHTLMHDLQHPYIHRVHDCIFGSFQPSKLEPATGKVILLRDYVALGSIRDKLNAVRVPLLGFDEKYPLGKAGTPLVDVPLADLQSAASGGGSSSPAGKAATKQLTEPLHLLLVAKQVLSAMMFLESVGLRVDFVHCGNVIVLADGRRTASGQQKPCIALSDFENALVNIAQPRFDKDVLEAAASSGGGTDDDDAAARTAAVDKACQTAGLRAFGLVLYELAAGKRAPSETCAWPPDGFNVSSRPVQAMLLGIFRPGEPYANTGATNASYSCLRDVAECETMQSVTLEEEHLASMPLPADVAAAREKHAPMLTCVRAGDGVGALAAAEAFLKQRVASDQSSAEAERKAALKQAKKERAAAAVARIQAEASAVALAAKKTADGGGGAGSIWEDLDQLSPPRAADVTPGARGQGSATGYVGELTVEVAGLLAACCEGNPAKAPHTAIEKLCTLAGKPTGGVMAEWLAGRLTSALAPDADQCHGAVKTVSLLAELVQAGSKEFRTEIKLQCAVQLSQARGYEKTDPDWGDKPARMVRNKAEQLSGLLLGY